MAEQLDTKRLARVAALLTERYVLESECGRGGMATVYAGRDLKHGRAVAIKVLRPEIAASVGAARFLREIEIAAQLRHPHILPLYDSGEVDDFLYYVMPLAEGESLRTRLTGEPQLPLSEALRIAREVADALGYAHSRGIVHRDVKPENVLLESGHAMVADFGIARALTQIAGDALTQTGSAIGTPYYMSPEQAMGEPVDARADVYSLGCMLYEMLAGGPPFKGPTALAIMARHSTEQAPPLSVVRHDIPDGVERAILRAMAKLPADRFATASDFAAALDHAATTVSTPGSFPTSALPEVPRSVAVLPFANLSGDAGDEYLSDGITDELIHALGRVPGLQVVARTSAFAFKGRNEDVRTIGERLKVGVVLEGSVRRAGDRIRVTVQLVSATDGYQMWSERYERELRDVFAMQDEIAHAISATLQVTLLVRPQWRSALASKNGRAVDLYLRGRQAWNLRTEAALKESVNLLQQALEADPGFALAHAALADAYTLLGVYGAASPRQVMPLAKAAANQALALGSGFAEGWTARACVEAVYDWNWAAAAEDFRRAILTNPQYATAHHWYAVNFLAPLGRFADARAELEQAASIDPLAGAIGATTGFVRYLEGDHAGAEAAYLALLERNYGFALAHYFLGELYEGRGAYDKAIQHLRTAADLAGGSAETLAALARAEASTGHRSEARRILQDLEQASQRGYVSAALIGLVQAGLGELDHAFDSLRQAVEQRAPELVWVKVRPTFALLRQDARFAAVVAELGLGEDARPDR